MRKFLQILSFLLIALTIVSLWSTQGTLDKLTHTAGTSSDDKTGAAAEIGGGFTLIDQEGRPVSEKDFHGRIMLVFFGFTQCPDICPVTAATMSKTMELLKDKADNVAPIFISVDPEHDTPKVLKEFLSNFDPHMIGLTGTPKQIKDVASAYKAYFAKNGAGWSDAHDDADAEDDEDSKYDSKKNDENEIDHSGFIYMMGRDGTYITHFPYDATPQQIADSIKANL